MQRRRVAYLTTEYPAPSHTFIRREVEALRARGITIDTFSIHRPSLEARFSPSDRKAIETTTYLLPVSIRSFLKAHLLAAMRRPYAYFKTFWKAIHHRVPGARSLLWSLFYFAEAIILAAKLEASEIDHLHNHFAISSATVGLLASSYLGIRWSLTLHGSADWSYPSVYLLPEKIKEAAFVACVSQYGCAQALRMSPPSHWDKMFVSHCGVDLMGCPAPRKSARSNGRLRLVTVGRLSPEKGQYGLLRAFASLVAQGVDAELRIIGDGPLRTSLSKAIIDLGLQCRCTLDGQKTEAEVLDALAEADLFVLSSFMEGLPVVLMEALAMHVPAIAPRVAGIPELIRDGDTGLLFTAGDWSELAAQMERAARDSILRNGMADRGRILVAKQFEIHTVVEPIAKRFLADD